MCRNVLSMTSDLRGNIQLRRFGVLEIWNACLLLPGLCYLFGALNVSFIYIHLYLYIISAHFTVPSQERNYLSLYRRWKLNHIRLILITNSRTDLHEEDDANVALFHPQSGAGVVYGTKQGQIACALSPEVLEKRGLWLATNENIENMDETDDGDPLRSNFENEGNYEQRDHPYQ